MEFQTVENLFDAIIDEIVDYTNQKGNKEMANIQKDHKYSNLDLSIFVVKNAKIENAFKNYQKKFNEFLDNVKYQKEETKAFPEISDDDCFLAYGLLCGFLCMFKGEKETIFKKFNIEKFPYLFKVINDYTDIKNLKNIYDNKFGTFSKENGGKNADNFQKWFKVLYEKNLSSIPIIEQKNESKKKKKKSKSHSERNKNEVKPRIEANIKINDKNEINNNLNKEGILSPKRNESENKSAEETTEDTKSLNGKNGEIKIPLEDNSQNDVNKEGNIQKPNNNEIQIIKEENSQNNISPDNKISNQNEQSVEKDNENIDNLLEQFGNEQATFSNKEKIMFKLINKINQQLKETKTELKETKTELDGTKTELKETETKLSERIDLLEKHQVLLYNQMALYQTSRDNGKSIFFYLYQYFELNGKEKLFDKTKEVFNYLEEKKSTIQANEHQKLIMKKFLRIMYFINQYHNKILHNQLKSKTKKLIKQIQQNDKSFRVFPEFNYKQFIESIKYFIKNITSNKEIQAVLFDAYENYSIDKDLESILDKKSEAISLEDNTIVFKIKDNEVDEAVNYLNNLKIGGESLESLCDKTSWDKK